MATTETTKLASQVFVSHEIPRADAIDPVADRVFWKPTGGLWTSTLDDEGGQWLRWLIGEGYSLEQERWGGRLWRLEPTEANLLVIRGPDDLWQAVDSYPHPRAVELGLVSLSSFKTMLDWAAIAEDYDGVHVPNPWPWRFGIHDYDASMFFYSMDAECTCWFRWCFEGRPVELDPEPFLAKLRGDE